MIALLSSILFLFSSELSTLFPFRMVVWPGVMMQMEAGEERSLEILPRSVIVSFVIMKGAVLWWDVVPNTQGVGQ